MSENSLEITGDLAIPASEISYRYSRSSGPGGQHVNKSETQVELLWDLRQSPSVSEDQRARLLAALAHRLDSEGVLHLVSGATRSQERNRQAVTERFLQVLQAGLRPRRKRVRTKTPAAARARRLEAKRRRSAIKQMRTAPADE